MPTLPSNDGVSECKNLQNVTYRNALYIKKRTFSENGPELTPSFSQSKKRALTGFFLRVFKNVGSTGFKRPYMNSFWSLRNCIHPFSVNVLKFKKWHQPGFRDRFRFKQKIARRSLAPRGMELTNFRAEKWCHHFP